MHVLGINYFFHDSSVCLVRDGKLIVAIEEERLSRDKHTTAFPELAIERALELAGVKADAIDAVAWAVKPSHNWTAKLRYAAVHGPNASEFLRYELRRNASRQAAFQKWMWRTWPNPLRRPRLHHVEHHLSHVAGSFLVSPYQEAALLGVDGSGEWATSFLGVGLGSAIECFHQSYFPQSLGSFYEAVTEFCGFRPNYDEGKTMGLAPYGDAKRFYDTVAAIARVGPDGAILLDQSYFQFQFHGPTRCAPKFYDTFGAPRKPDKTVPFEDHHKDVAAAFQRVLEERALEMCDLLHQRTKCRYLVVAGGVALNSVMNGRIVRESAFDDLYVMPGAGDNGTSIGAAYYVYNVLLGQPRNFVHDDPYVGTWHADADIERALKARGLPVVRIDDVPERAAAALDQGKILGWFQGKMEFGPRSLGNRSILANPTLPDMKEVLNARVKHREAFRPFAPSVISEARQAFFASEVNAPFMLKVCPVLEDKRARLPAITHVDGSARLQTVHKETNPRFHAMISAFGKRTGVPVVLNTSFNVMGQPIVESPEDAIDCYLSTGIDELFIGDYHVAKQAKG
jgi:carbamoyltransferase